ncbi:MAG TPA: hypothetical protein VGW34_11875, partial [Allosphingosinicella sp.]|nr:hypothetical protein [Allosphingosinicella sp.]
YAEAKAAELGGLDPGACDLAGLATVAAAGDSAATDRAAQAIALAVATHYTRGRIDDGSRSGSPIAQDADPDRLAAGLHAALRENRVRAWLRGLLPQDARHAALRAGTSGSVPAPKPVRRSRV